MPAVTTQHDATQQPVIIDPMTSGCTYCGLPVAAADGFDSATYCCYGCRFAHAVVQEQGEVGAIRWTVIRLGLSIFFTMNLMAFTMTMWSLDVYEVDADPFQLKLFEVFRWLSMLLAVPVLLLLGVPLLQNSIDSWRRRIYSTDLLIGLAVIAAYVTSVVNVLRGNGTTYFEVGATVLVMITLGRWIEAAGKQKATESLDKLLTLLPETVTRTGHVAASDATPPATVMIAPQTIAATEIAVGDLLRIRAGERFAADAVIFDGITTVDEQVFTGESQPIDKRTGDSVLAGTVNLDGDILVRVVAGFREGSFGRLLATLQEARNAQGYHHRLADRVAACFFPVVTAIAFCTFAWHWPSGIGNAIHAAMSVLLIACPCALGLATPLAVWTALSTALNHGVLFRSGEAIERLAGIQAICFDKTGTLTTGTPQVFQSATFGTQDAEFARRIAAELAGASSHPFSKSVLQHVATSGSTDVTSLLTIEPRLQSIRTVPGGGVEATTTDGRHVRLGSVEFACCKLHDAAALPDSSVPEMCVSCRARVALGPRVQLDRLRMAADQQAASIVLLSIDRVPALGFLVAESIRPEASLALQELLAETKSLHVLSGDRPAKGRFLKEHLSLPGLQIECSLTPDQKVGRVASVRSEHGSTAMVGDGINDAPALAGSDVGIAMGCGADVSRDSAQVCLLTNDLTQIPWAINLARRTMTVIRQNLFWAFGYNTVGVCLAAAGLLNPAIAAGLMIASSLLVISNSLRLLKDDSPQENSTSVESSDHNQVNRAEDMNGEMRGELPPIVTASENADTRQPAEVTV